MMMRMLLRVFALSFICAFVTEVIVLAAIAGEGSGHHHSVISVAKPFSLVQVMAEEAEEVEEETGNSRLEFDLANALIVHHSFHFNRFESSVRNFRSLLLRFSRMVPVYTAIHSLLI